ncbi:serine/arginine repetitive matrix protein 1-like, partial [Schistocerca americana]|uniref:serine/arginine repetitive matrix protein 1-like n=1 Tax=Schistocerca americana TaxID=7009 RepID=UPI001F4FC1BB
DRHRAGEIVRTSRTCRMNRIGDDEEPGPHPRVASPRSSRPEQTHRAEIELASRTTQGARQRHPTPPAPTPEDLCTAMIQEKLEQLRRDRDARATELAKRRDQDGPTTSDNSSSDDCRTKTQIPTEQHHAMDHHEESSDSDVPFQEVRRRRKGTKRRKAEENTRMQTESRAVPTTNYYAPLQKQDEPTADQHQLQPNDTTSQHTPAPPPPKPRIPPAALDNTPQADRHDAVGSMSASYERMMMAMEQRMFAMMEKFISLVVNVISELPAKIAAAMQQDRHRAGEIVRTSRTCRMNRIGDDEEPGPHPRVASPRSSRPEQTHRAEIELASRTTQGARQRHPTPPAPTPEDLCTAMIQEKLEQLRRDRDARATELAKRRDQDGPTTSDNSSSDDCRTKTQIPTEQHHAMDHHEESSDSDVPFQEVRRRRKGTKRRKAEENTRMQTESRAVPTTNYYAPLQKQDEPTADQHQLQPNDTTSQHTPAPPPPKPRIPPAALDNTPQADRHDAVGSMSASYERMMMAMEQRMFAMMEKFISLVVNVISELPAKIAAAMQQATNINNPTTQHGSATRN